MDKRTFIKTGIAGIIGMVSFPLLARGKTGMLRQSRRFRLPELPYSYDALEPYIDKKSLYIHHTGYHADYARNFNAALKEAGLTPSCVREILKASSQYPETVIKNGAGYLNHRIFWQSVSPTGGGLPYGRISSLITRDFGSFEQFKEHFESKAFNTGSSGWVWLVYRYGRLKITATSDAYNPFMNTLSAEQQGFPLLCLDLCEHAYDHNDAEAKSEYIPAFWKIINWESANLKLEKATAINE
jgi:Fe-Mn family superoxide dismutase